MNKSETYEVKTHAVHPSSSEACAKRLTNTTNDFFVFVSNWDDMGALGIKIGHPSLVHTISLPVQCLDSNLVHFWPKG